MSDDTQKIIWRKATKKQPTDSASDGFSGGAVNVTAKSQPVINAASQKQTTHSLSMADAVDLAQRSGDNISSQVKNPSSLKNEIDSIKADIEKSLGETNNQSNSLSQEKDVMDTPVTTPPTAKISPNNVQTSTNLDTTVPVVAALSSTKPKSSFSVKDEIDKILAEKNKNPVSNQKSAVPPLNPEIPVGLATQPIAETSFDNPAEQVDSLRESIKADLGQHQPSSTQSKGIEQTYYGDVSGAMGSNKPATMAELLRKARFEKKQKAILSPKSKKNLLFIVGSILLLVLAVFLFSGVFKSSNDVEYITEKRVDSLVYSDLDTGVNITNIGSSKVKQAVRKVVETDLEEGSLNQIYYAGEDENKNLKRLNIREVFDATEHTPPQLLYENIEGEFMHGVYKTDENQPFVILKSLSYDKVFEGMKEWEPTMIDDLATYLDLPDEALDRSLLQDGFSDDIIKNKNVRVARFIPRNNDRSFLENIKDKITSLLSLSVYAQNSGYTVYGKITDVAGTPLPDATLFVQDLGTSTQANNSGNYSIYLSIPGTHVLEYKAPNYLPQLYDIDGEKQLNVSLELEPNTGAGNSGGTITTNNAGNGLVCYEKIRHCLNTQGNEVDASLEGQNGIFCYDELKNDIDDPVYGPEKENLPGFGCLRFASGEGIVTGDAAINNLNTADVCFHAVTGDRLNTTNQSLPDYFSPEHPLAVCFRSFECIRYACVDGNNNEVPLSQEGQSGVRCGETNDIVDEDFAGQKICHEYTQLSSLNNIGNATLCFDQSGQLTTSNPGNQSGGVRCISPLNRDRRLCLTDQDQLVQPAFGVSETDYKICFDPLEDAALGNAGDQFQTLDPLIVKAIAASLGHRFALLAALGNFVGLGSDHIAFLKSTSEFFYDIATTDNYLENDILNQGLVVVKRLEEILDFIDPTGSLSQPGPDGDLNFFGKLNFAIELIKDIFGFSHNAAWSTIGNTMPQGVEIYAGESAEGVDAIQGVLSLVGLMETSSVTGTIDLVTQNAITDFQMVNGLAQTGVIDLETLDVMNGMVSGYGQLFGASNQAIVNDYFAVDGLMGLGTYSDGVQSLQIILYSEGYDIDAINGVFDPQTCIALMQYQEFNNLITADPNGCVLTPDTIAELNQLIDDQGYLGSGYASGKGFLEGVGMLSGRVGPGVVNFSNDAEASSINEGDIVLMYTFLDEQTILITRHESVITEIIKRRALDDIFNNS